MMVNISSKTLKDMVELPKLSVTRHVVDLKFIVPFDIKLFRANQQRYLCHTAALLSPDE